jgi:hypothetical protein
LAPCRPQLPALLYVDRLAGTGCLVDDKDEIAGDLAEPGWGGLTRLLAGSRVRVENAEVPAEVVGIYRVNADRSIQALESVQVGPADQVFMFLTYEGVIVVIGPMTADADETMRAYGR